MDTLVLTIAVPAVAGLLALLLPRRLSVLASLLGALGALATFVAGASLASGGHTATVPVFEIAGLNADLALRADGFSGWAAAFVGLVGFLGALYASGWFRGRGGAPGRFHALLLLAVAGAATVLLADNLLLLVFGWEIVTITLFLMVVAGRDDGGPGAVKAIAILGLGDLALLAGTILVGFVMKDAGHAAPWSLATLRAHPIGPGGGVEILVWLLFFTAAAAKAGAFPFHTWIPTMSTGTNASVMALLPGSIDKVLGIYLLVRITLGWASPPEALRLVMMLVGAITLLGAVFMAMVQHDLRRLLSYHAVSQVGYMLLGIGTGTVVGVVGGVFHMVNNAIYKACLFLGAGSVERETGTMELSRLGGLGRAMPVTFGCMFVAALAISGIPPLNGFASKWLVYQACVVADQPLFLIVALFGSALTLASFVKVLHSVFWGPQPSRLDGVREGAGGIGMPIAMITLATLCVVLGLLAPAFADDFLGPVVGLPTEGGATAGAALGGGRAAWAPLEGPGTPPLQEPGVFRPLPVAGLLFLGFLAALLLAFLGHIRMRRVRSVFVGGQRLDRDVNRFPGTEFYRTVSELPALGAVLKTGDGGKLDPYAWGRSTGAPIVRLLRRLHTGLASDYLAWCLIGLVVLFSVLLIGR